MDYKGKTYRALVDYGNLSRPDDLCSQLLYEFFISPSRTFAQLHSFYAGQVLIYTFFALYQKRGVTVFLFQEVAALALMWRSYKFTEGTIEPSMTDRKQFGVRAYCYTNQIRTA